MVAQLCERTERRWVAYLNWMCMWNFISIKLCFSYPPKKKPVNNVLEGQKSHPITFVFSPKESASSHGIFPCLDYNEVESSSFKHRCIYDIMKNTKLKGWKSTVADSSCQGGLKTKTWRNFVGWWKYPMSWRYLAAYSSKVNTWETSADWKGKFASLRRLATKEESRLMFKNRLQSFCLNMNFFFLFLQEKGEVNRN